MNDSELRTHTCRMSDVMQRLLKISAKPMLALPRSVKRLVAVAADVCLCVLATWVAFSLKFGELISLSIDSGVAALVSIVIAIPIFIILGLYRAIFRYAGWPAIWSVGIAMALYGLVFLTIVMTAGFEGIPRTLGVTQPLFLFIGVAGSRVAARFWLGKAYQRELSKQQLPKVLIYGAGSAGRQLAGLINNNHEYYAIGYVDDNQHLHGQTLNGLPIYSSLDLGDLIANRGVAYVLLAIPSTSRRRRQTIIDQVSKHHVTVRSLPSVAEIVGGQVSIKDLKELDVEDLLGREAVEPNKALLSKKITDKVVMVTGAGGSIGSELCRQILSQKPKRLLLVEMGEFALYSIHAELESIQKRNSLQRESILVPLLGSVQDGDTVTKVMSAWAVDTVYHAAAYKHVPLVEHNVLEGLKNNVFGTLELACAAIAVGVSDFVLISTDKAVRPTNVMGATKRVAELCLQALQGRNDSRTCFSMVRFGNVLASSGSVIPKFRDQISEGGPVTVTHPDITRYFMTISEAAQLVIQAGALAEGGEVFLLDMGEPIKIADLARLMIRLSGLTEKTTNSSDGDIEIQFSGLRPGEKLFEELLIGDNAESTIHPKIMKAQEEGIHWVELEPKLNVLRRVATNGDEETAIEILKELVQGFVPNVRAEDSVNIEQHGQIS